MLVSSAAAHTAARSRPAAPVRGTGLVSLQHELSKVPQNRLYSLLIVPSSDAALAATKPGRSLVYFSGTDVNTNWNAGVPYRQALARAWLLTDGAGTLLKNAAFGDNYVGDVGNPAYQRAWLRNVLRFLRTHHDDGVYIDDVLRDLTPLTGSEASKYPTMHAWAAAQLSFVKTVGQALRAQGYYVLVNASGYVPGDRNSDDGSSTVAWWRQLAPYVSGLANEYYAQISSGNNALRASGTSWMENWDGWERLVRTAQSLDRDFVGITYGQGGDLGTLMYAKASFLLDWNGGGGAFIHIPTDGTDPSTAIWATNIGGPAAPKQRVGTGWLRRYTAGVALVNPSPTDPQVFDLGRSYAEPDGTVVDSITLPPTSGLILRATPAHG